MFPRTYAASAAGACSSCKAPSVLDPLAAADVGIFAISTFDTDYVLVQAYQLDAALSALRGDGHVMREAS